MWWSKGKAFALLLTLSFLGCGYRLQGTTVSSLPPHIKKVHIPIFRNGTLEEGIEVKLTEALRSQILEDGRLRLADGLQDAEAVIQGEVREFTLRPISFNRQDRVREYRLRITVQVTLRDLENNRVLLDQTLRADREYRVSEALSSNEQAQRETLNEAAKDFARELKSVLIEGF